MKKSIASFLLFLFAAVSVKAQEMIELHKYDALNSALEGHVTQILQDRKGLLWLSTWNGLYRFDGYEFSRLKPLAGDGCSMTSDRIRDIWLSRNGDLFCRTDDGTFRFDINEYRFHDMKDKAEQAEADEALAMETVRSSRHDGILEYTDPQGLCWQVIHDVLYCKMRTESPIKQLPMEQPATIGCLYKDGKNRIWVTTKDDATVRMLDDNGNPLGYLTPQGTLQQAYCSFGHPVYAIHETTDGHLWLGSKPDGLFRLSEQGDGLFTVQHVKNLETGNVYSLTEDSWGRLWVGLLGTGLACVENPGAPEPNVIGSVPGYPLTECPKIRRLHITADGIMICATTNGIVVGKLQANLGGISFRQHSRDFRRPSSLSCNATMDVVETADGRIFVSTETDGICEITSPTLLADTLSFRCYNTNSGLMPNDMVVGMALGQDEQLLVVCARQLVNLDIYKNSYENLGHLFFRHPYQFSEATPVLLDNGQWIIGTTENVIFLPQSMAHHSNYQPPLLITGIAVQNQKKNLATQNIDTLRLLPPNRTLTVHFAALDYTNPEAINYQFRLGSDTAQWNNIGHDHSVTLLDLAPGTYQLYLRSTNAEGKWTDNVRKLTIIVEPTFWETPWAKVLMVLAALAVVVALMLLILYIRRIKRKQQQTLQAYLELLEDNKGSTPEEAENTKKNEADTNAPEMPADPFVQHVLDFVEKNMANGDADVSQMAEACAVSRSVLQRKMKQLVGLTPSDFMREARLKHACNLLRNTSLTVAEVAYRSGFNDPKYFSRSFKQSLGMSPSDYKAQQQ